MLYNFMFFMVVTGGSYVVSFYNIIMNQCTRRQHYTGPLINLKSLLIATLNAV